MQVLTHFSLVLDLFGSQWNQDPPALFERPIVTVSFFGEANLVFGASFDPMRQRQPVFAQPLRRGTGQAFLCFVAMESSDYGLIEIEATSDLYRF